MFLLVEVVFARILTTRWPTISMSSGVFGFTDIRDGHGVHADSIWCRGVRFFALRQHLSRGFKVGRCDPPPFRITSRRFAGEVRRVTSRRLINAQNKFMSGQPIVGAVALSRKSGGRH